MEIDNKMLKPSRIRNLSDVERAWIGAAMDADGTIGMRKRNNAKTDRPFFVFYSIEPETISVFLRIIGVGSVSFRTQERGSYENSVPIWSWRIDRKLEVLNLCKQIAPYSLKAQKMLLLK